MGSIDLVYASRDFHKNPRFQKQSSFQDIIHNHKSRPQLQFRSKASFHELKPNFHTIPKNFHLDKEKLYEQNLNIKQEYNKVCEENLKLKTKIFQLEKNAEKIKNESSNPNHSKENLVDKLKQNNRELKNQLNEKLQEIENIKKYIRYTRVQELEAEVLSYRNECFRLRSVVDSVFRQLDLRDLRREKVDKNLRFGSKVTSSSELKGNRLDLWVEEDKTGVGVQGLQDDFCGKELKIFNNQQRIESFGDKSPDGGNGLIEKVKAKDDLDDFFEVFKAKATLYGVKSIEHYILDHFFDSQVSESDIINLCRSRVFELSPVNTRRLIEFILENQNSLSRSACIKKFISKFENWNFIRKIEIKENIEKLVVLIQNSMENILGLLELHQSSTLTIYQIIEEMKKLKIVMSQNDEICIKALFYYCSGDFFRLDYKIAFKVIVERVNSFVDSIQIEDFDEMKKSMGSFFDDCHSDCKSEMPDSNN